MSKAISKSNLELSKYTPKWRKFKLIRKRSQQLSEREVLQSEKLLKIRAKVDINDDGVVTISAADEEIRKKDKNG